MNGNENGMKGEATASGSNNNNNNNNNNNMMSNGGGPPAQGEEGAASGQQPQQPPAPTAVTPDMLYKLSKKIAQLTKVIYSLNTRNDDLEQDLEAVRLGYEEKLQLCQQQLHVASQNLGVNGAPQPMTNGNANNGHDDARKELTDAREALQASEAKVKAMELEVAKKQTELEDLQKAVASKQQEASQPKDHKQPPMTEAVKSCEAGCQTTSTPASNGEQPPQQQQQTPPESKKKVSLLEQQVKQLNKEKLELNYRVDRLDILNENFRLEGETFRKEIKEITAEKNKLQIELSAARIEINYEKEMANKARMEAEAAAASATSTTSAVNGTSIPDSTDAAEKGPATTDPSSSKATTTEEAEAKKKLDDQFTDELLEKIETLTKEKGEVIGELAEAKASEASMKKQLETMKQASIMQKHQEAAAAKKNTRARSSQTDVSSLLKCEGCDANSEAVKHLESQVTKLQGEKTQYEERIEEVTRMAAEAKAAAGLEHEAGLAQLRSETQNLQKTLEAEMEKSRVELGELAATLQQKQADLESTRADHDTVLKQITEIEAAAQAAKAEVAARDELIESIRKELSASEERELNLKVDMGQNSEKLYAVEERCKSIEKERDDLKRKCIEYEAKMDVLSKSERAAEKDASERLKQLEKALEEALIEREEILEAAEKEIQQQKTIAIETEQKMMDDFEWKLRAIEAEYREKIKRIEDGVDVKVRAAREEYARAKDDEFTRMSIAMRRDMEEKIRTERCNLKTALDTQNKAERDKAIELYRLEKDHDTRLLQKSWEEEEKRLNREIRTMQRRIDQLPQDIEAATRTLRSDCDKRVQEERRNTAKVEAKCQEEYDRMKDHMHGEIRRIRAKCDDRIAEYEAKLEAAHGNRMSSMFQMKEEVETEFTDRMEQLRDMYQNEMALQTDKLEEERRKAKELEARLEKAIDDQRSEIEELTSYYTQREEELEAKIEDLLGRLQDQTAIAVKLQAELDEYEWYEEDEDGGTGGGGDGAGAGDEAVKRPPSSRSHHSRPPSTKPLAEHRYPSSSHLAVPTTGSHSSHQAASYYNPYHQTSTVPKEEEEGGDDEHLPDPLEDSTSYHHHRPSDPFASMSSMSSAFVTAPPSEASNSGSQVPSPNPPPRTRPAYTIGYHDEVAVEDEGEEEAARGQDPYSPQSNTTTKNSHDRHCNGHAVGTRPLIKAEAEDDSDLGDDTEESEEVVAKDSKRKSWHKKILKSASGVLHRGGGMQTEAMSTVSDNDNTSSDKNPRQKRNSTNMGSYSTKKSQCSQQ